MLRPTQVAFEGSCLLAKQVSGINGYAFHLLKALYQNKQYKITLFLKAEKFFKKKKLLFQNAPIQWYHKQFAWNPKRYALAHSPDIQFLHFKNTKNIMTIHDLAIFKKVAQIPGFTNPAFVQKIHHKLTQAIPHIDHFIAVSSCTARDMQQLFNIIPEKISVIPLAPLPFQKLPQESLRPPILSWTSKPYFLFVGSLSIRKNLLGMLQALALLPRSYQIPTIFAGHPGPGYLEIQQQAQQLNLQTHFIHSLNETEREFLYKNCTALLFCTYYEGFGIPILEAFSFGKPVLVGQEGAALETAGGHAFIADPHSPEDMAQKIQQLLNHPPASKTLKQYAAQFSWEKTAQKTQEVYAQLLQH